MTGRVSEPHFPGSAPIEAYGRGGFRFAGMSHRGSLLIVPSAIWAWPVQTPSEITDDALVRVFSESDAIDVLLIGSGHAIWPMPDSLRWRLRDVRIVADVMLTGAAVRTYNIMLNERRRVAAALLAID